MKICFRSLGTYGRLGNQLFEVAALLGISYKLGAQACIPTTWPYRQYFNIPDEYFHDISTDLGHTEAQHQYDPVFIDNLPKDRSVNIKGCFQSEKYFIEIKDKIREWLKPRVEGRSLGDWSVGLHIRRGDYVGNPNYTQLDADYYKAVIERYFKDPSYRFYITTDDVPYAKEHFHGSQYYIAEREPIEDLAILISCKHHILSPSSFSWWGTYLAREGGINIRPKRTHVGRLLKLDESDMWQPEWTIESVTDHMGAKVVMLCYADKNFVQEQLRLINHTNRSAQFDNIYIMDRRSLEATEFYKTHRYILDLERGGGYWLWKPYYILETLKALKDNDILLYMDSGDLFYGDIRKFLSDQLKDKDMLLMEGHDKNRLYTKRNAFCVMECDSPEFTETIQVEAGVMAIKNTVRSRKIIKEWLNWCEDPDVLTDEPSENNYPGFVDHRHDQSILTNLKVMYNIPCNQDLRSYVVCNVKAADTEDNHEPGDLSDVTFVIPVKYDHPDRLVNTRLVVAFLRKWFNTTIIIGEQGPRREFEGLKKDGVKYMYFPDGPFHRTKFINEMVKASTTPFIFNWDADVIIPVAQINMAVGLLRAGYDFVYPYDGAYLHVSKVWIPITSVTLDTKQYEGVQFKGINDNSVGGAVGFNKEAFVRVGMENENYISHAPEDVDRAIRFDMLGRMIRVKGPLYHLEHWRGPDSTHNGHEDVVMNRRQIRLVRGMTKEQLVEYIKTWPWVSMT